MKNGRPDADVHVLHICINASQRPKSEQTEGEEKQNTWIKEEERKNPIYTYEYIRIPSNDITVNINMYTLVVIEESASARACSFLSTLLPPSSSLAFRVDRVIFMGILLIDAVIASPSSAVFLGVQCTYTRAHNLWLTRAIAHNVTPLPQSTCYTLVSYKNQIIMCRVIIHLAFRKRPNGTRTKNEFEIKFKKKNK